MHLESKTLSEAGILEDNAQGWKIVRKMNSWLRSKASRATVKFWHEAGVSFVSQEYDYRQKVLSPISINLLVVYRESVNLIGYITRRLSDSQQLWIANENRSLIYFDQSRIFKF